MSTSTLVSNPSPLPRPRVALLGLGLWALAVLAVAASGVIALERRALIPPAILGSTLALVVLYVRSPSLRALADGAPLRVPILFHFVRLPIGVLFLLRMGDGLDADFARLAGVGDILAGGLALLAAVAASASPPTRLGRVFVLAWSSLGLLDILLVVATAARILLLSDHPESLSIMMGFPMPAIPLFVVPLVIATHLLVFRRLSPRFVARA